MTFLGVCKFVFVIFCVFSIVMFLKMYQFTYLATWRPLGYIWANHEGYLGDFILNVL
jgi:hypothetical protein